ncbi:radical SAM protein [Proteinivorax hydrogeniformans]|uniref:Radical SAM protein n=1 Tax=Proteinivorax hydrogeniformans TaxID=1826727 RepID=A0AAU8HW32_9FIRM
MTNVAIVDGYLDEPSCLGVPPYIAPHVRYTYGGYMQAGIKKDKIHYFTIDQLREDDDIVQKLKTMDMVTIISGTTVPGKYLGGKPIALKEIDYYAGVVKGKVVLSGPIVNVDINFEQVDHVAWEIPGALEYKLLTDIDITEKETPQEIIDTWAKVGAEVTRLHPNFPELVCEIETFRGCPRQSHCSFCSERLKKVTYQRSVKGIIEEVKRLYSQGNRNFRLGAQTDLLLFGAKQEKNSLIPNPEIIEELYKGIREVAPDLKVLHMDNINPATIADYPTHSKQALEAIAKYNTPGDTAAFGLESADEKVLKANNIGTDVEKTFKAIKIMNEVCAFREGGIPKLLPGINLLHGLSGESKQTMAKNYDFLSRIYEENLMVRRINIRQVNPLRVYKSSKVNAYKFKQYKEKINETINKPMLKRVFPTGTLMKDVIIEKVQGKLGFGRQLGTYPILVGVYGDFAIGDKVDVKIVDYGHRSLTGVLTGLKITDASIDQLQSLPGIGKTRATKIFINKHEINGESDLKRILPDYDAKNIRGLIAY